MAGFYRSMLDRVTHLPGVENAGINTILPIQDWGLNGDFEVEGFSFSPGKAPLAELRAVSSGYFQSLGIPLVEGRYFTGQESATAPRGIIVNQALAQHFWPSKNPGGNDAIGRHLRFDGHEWIPIVGVVGNVRAAGLTNDIPIEVYFPYEQAPWPILLESASLVIRSHTAGPEALAAAVRGEVHAIDREQPIYNVKPMQTAIDDSVSNRRMILLLLGAFAVLALLLAALGIYGVISYAVNQRGHEMGVRIALGASRGAVVRLILREGISLAAAGVGLGLAASLILTRLLRSILFQVSPTDPWTLGGVAVLLSLVAIAASVIPARRATKANPMAPVRMTRFRLDPIAIWETFIENK